MSELKPAVCKCGHKSKSKQPEYYQCTHCYYTARAKDNEEKAKEFLDRASKLRVEASRYLRKAWDFRKKHPRKDGCRHG